MPSTALRQWASKATDALDEIEAAHRALGGQGPGRRHATLQVNHAYAVLLSSQFQRFCRDLHSEAVDFVAANTRPARSAELVRLLLTQGRKFDHGNPSPGNIGSDFARLGMQFWQRVRKVDRRAEARRNALEELNGWRNAIAHQDWTRVGGQSDLRLGAVRRWRRTCNGLVGSFDRAVHDHLLDMVGAPPW